MRACVCVCKNAGVSVLKAYTFPDVLKRVLLKPDCDDENDLLHSFSKQKRSRLQRVDGSFMNSPAFLRVACARARNADIPSGKPSVLKLVAI